jgi:hypothetical protein
MDWSNVFSEDGEEEGKWEIKMGSRVTFLRSLDGNYTPGIAYAFTVNYILGVGVLGMPYAFLKAGVVLASATIIFTSLITYATVMWVANAAHWGMQAKVLQRGNPFRSPIQLSSRPLNDGTVESGMSRSSSTSSLVDRLDYSHFGYASLDSSSSSTALGIGGSAAAEDATRAKSKSKSRSPRRRALPRAQQSTSTQPQQEAPEAEPEVAELVQEFLGSRARVVFQVSSAEDRAMCDARCGEYPSAILHSAYPVLTPCPPPFRPH